MVKGLELLWMHEYFLCRNPQKEKNFLYVFLVKMKKQQKIVCKHFCNGKFEMVVHFFEE